MVGRRDRIYQRPIKVVEVVFQHLKHCFPSFFPFSYSNELFSSATLPTDARPLAGRLSFCPKTREKPRAKKNPGPSFVTTGPV